MLVLALKMEAGVTGQSVQVTLKREKRQGDGLSWSLQKNRPADTFI